MTAVTEELAGAVLADAIAGAREPDPPPRRAVKMGYWHASRMGSARKVRTIGISPWAEVRRNYPAASAVALDQLMAVRPADVSGRLVLLHGPPGTGKISALRALAYQWRRWCQVDCVLDPRYCSATPATCWTWSSAARTRRPAAGGR